MIPVTRRPGALVALLACSLAVLLGLTGCSGLTGTGDANATVGAGSIVQVAADEREGPVEIAGTTLQGEPIDLADLRGEVVVLNVWGSWCKPCATEAPRLQEASENVDAQFVGLSFRETSQVNAVEFEEKYGITYPTIADQPSGVLALGRFAPTAPPSTYVLDRQGRVAAVISGEVRSISSLEDLVVEVGGEDGATDGATAGGGDVTTDG